MHFKKKILILFFLYSCVPIDKFPTDTKVLFEDSFSNDGFTLVYNDELKKNKIVKKSIDSRSLTIYQKNIKKGQSVKVTNLLNNKSLIAKVGDNVNYPIFYNSVVSERIYKELDINSLEPYINIYHINENSIFVAKKAKTFDEEKEVANKAPIEGISIKDLNRNLDKKQSKLSKKDFKYIIKIADFYFEDTAILMKKRILEETNIKKVNIKTNSSNSFRVFLGPFNDLNSLKNNFNNISNLNFENLELIKQ